MLVVQHEALSRSDNGLFWCSFKEAVVMMALLPGAEDLLIPGPCNIWQGLHNVEVEQAGT